MSLNTSPTPSAETASTVAPELICPDTQDVMSKSRMTRFSVGFIAIGLLWAVGLATISVTLLPQRLKDIGVDSPEAVLGSVNAITAIVSLVSNLLFGNLSDRSRFRIGRRTPWVVSGAIIAGITLFGLGVLNSVAMISLSYCLAMVGLNMMLAPAVAVLSDRIPEKNRGTLSAFFGTGVTVGFAVGPMLGAIFLSNTTPGFVIAGVLMALSGIAAVAIWPREVDASTMPRTDSGSFLDLIKSFRPPIKGARDFWFAFLGRLFMLLSYQMVFAYQLYLLQDYVGLDEAGVAGTMAQMGLIALVVAIVGPMLSGPISDFLGRRKVPVVAASALFAIGVAIPWLMPTATGMLLFAAIAGLGYGVYTAVDQALNVDVLPNKEEAGKDLGILNLSTTLGQMAGPLITSAIVVATGGYTLIFPISITAAILASVLILPIRSVK